MGNKKTNLVIALYFGPRRRNLKESEEDVFFFLKLQVLFLLNIKHNLDQITFVISGEKPKGYFSVIKPLLSKYKVVTLKRANEGISYGAYSDAVAKYVNDFDFFIFLEDDFLFMLDDFDQIFKDNFYHKKNTSLASVSWSWRGRNHIFYKSFTFPHAPIAIFGTSKDILKKIIKEHGRLPYLTKTQDAYDRNQIIQTNVFTRYGEIVSLEKKYATLYFDQRGYQNFGDIKKNPCIVTSVEGLIDGKIKFCRDEKNMFNI